MSYKKKTAQVAEDTEKELGGFKAIDPALDLGEGCSIAVLEAAIAILREKIKTYNDALALVDSTKLDIEKLEKELKQLMQKARLGVAFKYGKESDQFKLIGGTSPTEAARKGAITRAKGKSDEESDD